MVWRMIYLHLPSWMIVNLVPWISCYVISNLRNFKNGCKSLNNFFLTHAEFSFAGMRVQWNGVCGRILLDNNTACMLVMLRPIRIHCFLTWISTGLFSIYILFVVYHMNTQFLFDMDLRVRDYCVSRRVSLWLLPKSESVCTSQRKPACEDRTGCCCGNCGSHL
jgi:hypothetical protein